MSTNYSDSDKTYRIETTISGGTIEDPVTGERHEVVSDDDGRGGEIEVTRPDSAQALVRGSNAMDFAGDAPTTGEVEAAQKARFEFGDTDVCMSFAESYHRDFESMSLDPAEGFDPKEGAANNDPRMKAGKMYHDLKERGYESEAAYLRALPSVGIQTDFCDYLTEHEAIQLNDD